MEEGLWVEIEVLDLGLFRTVKYSIIVNAKSRGRIHATRGLRQVGPLSFSIPFCSAFFFFYSFW